MLAKNCLILFTLCYFTTISLSKRHQIEAIYDKNNVNSNCTDNPHYSKCGLIVMGGYCRNRYYAKFCCKSCNEAGQLSSKSISISSVTTEVEDLHSKCTDNRHFGNCQVVVKGQYCSNKYYGKFCCKSCYEAGQLPVLDLENTIEE